jgi:hypothetical protein
LKERRQFKRPAKELKQHFSENRFYLLLANYHKETPYIFKMQSDGKVSPTWQRGGGSCVSLGNSCAVADYIMRQFDFTNMGFLQAVSAAIYIVNEVINIDSTCSRPIKLAALRIGAGKDLPIATIWEPHWIDLNLAEIERLQAKIKFKWSQQLNEIIDRAAKVANPFFAANVKTG